jgi:hypothetical protein
MCRNWMRKRACRAAIGIYPLETCENAVKGFPSHGNREIESAYELTLDGVPA